jgi:type IV pilus assembly protein PilB
VISFNRRVVRILEEGKHVEPAALQAAAEGASKDKSITTLLVEHKAITESDLLGVLAEQLGVPPVDLDRMDWPPDVAEWLPENLAKKANCIPISRLGGVLTIAVGNPFDVVRYDDLRLTTGCDLRLALALDTQIPRALEKAYRRGESALQELLEDDDPELALKEQLDDEVVDLADDTGGAEDAPIIKLVNLIIYNAIRAKASDIHVEPFEKKVIVRYRTDGVMAEAMSPPKKLQNAITSRLKIMASLDIAEKRRPQDGKFQVRVEGRQIDFRVSVLPTVHGEKVVLRILDSTNLALSLDSLGFEPEALRDFKEAIDAPYGMILVTGPTGSGKTTTLYSAVKEILTPEMNFVTVEDPVEYQLEGVNQVQVNVKRGLTFAGALRSILRQDPDIVMVGEIRDTETIEIAVRAALTGHLVLSTLHTNDASSTVTRMCDMGVDPFMVASSTLLVSAQRLIRKLCEHCKAAQPEAPAARLRAIGFLDSEIEAKPQLFRAVGCARCSGGYSGRFAILETLPVRDDVRRLVVEGASALQIKAHALEIGMVTLRRCAVRNAIRGRTSVDEVLRVTMDDRKRNMLEEENAAPKTDTDQAPEDASPDAE